MLIVIPMVLLIGPTATYKVVPEWTGRKVKDLHREYGNIFKHGNRNAASHLWSSFLLDRSRFLTHKRFVHISRCISLTWWYMLQGAWVVFKLTWLNQSVI